MMRAFVFFTVIAFFLLGIVDACNKCLSEDCTCDVSSTSNSRTSVLSGRASRVKSTDLYSPNSLSNFLYKFTFLQDRQCKLDFHCNENLSTAGYYSVKSQQGSLIVTRHPTVDIPDATVLDFSEVDGLPFRFADKKMFIVFHMDGPLQFVTADNNQQDYSAINVNILPGCAIMSRRFALNIDNSDDKADVKENVKVYIKRPKIPMEMLMNPESFLFVLNDKNNLDSLFPVRNVQNTDEANSNLTIHCAENKCTTQFKIYLETFEFLDVTVVGFLPKETQSVYLCIFGVETSCKAIAAENCSHPRPTLSKSTFSRSTLSTSTWSDSEVVAKLKRSYRKKKKSTVPKHH